jgi:diaminopimelate epimerase
MRRLRFRKMHGAGNDYVYLDGIDQDIRIDDAAGWAARLADRHFGIGSDGLILLARSDRADCRMVMWNADGSRGSMCGNGLRCLAAMARELGHVAAERMTVETDAGLRQAQVFADRNGRVIRALAGMGVLRFDPEPHTVGLGAGVITWYAVDAGNPHAVAFVRGDPEELALASVAREIERSGRFPDGVNVELVAVVGPDRLVQRTFERGSGETLACGSGATAAACAGLATGRLSATPVRVRVRGGELVIAQLEDGSWQLDGPVATVFEGTFET